MSRVARVVIPGLAHHVTQRGNRRMKVFFDASDYGRYRDELALSCRNAGVEVLAWCLMPNHVHLILKPADEGGLVRALAPAHQKYSWTVNQRNGWRGYLWQGRFNSFPMDDEHCLAAVRYVELNPVRAALAESADQWPWSSAPAHMRGCADALIKGPPWPKPLDEATHGFDPKRGERTHEQMWAEFLAGNLSDEGIGEQRRHAATGLPLGGAGFISKLEALTGRTMTLRPRGRPPRHAA